MNTTMRLEIFSRLAQATPNPTTELIHGNPFELLIAVMLSAQASDRSVNKVTSVLFSIANTPQGLLELGLEKLEEYLRSLNYYRTKARHILATCKIIQSQYHGSVPTTRKELEALPGVGRKTANVVLNTAFGEATIGVDTHIFRVANRTGLARGKTVREVEDKLAKVTPREYIHDAHHLLILHGRYVCKARLPDCLHCIINDLCEYPAKSFLNRQSTGQD
ncbi:MAG: endonuclease III [Pseudomonadota bacterium]|nr:endonuclease III [Pseudomonadota bacterium]